MENNRRVNGWTIKKEISVGDLVGIVLALSAVFAAYFNLDKRISLIEQAFERQQIQAVVDKTDLKENQLRMEQKVDKLLEKVR
jgi:hypothetical protein